MVGTMTRPVAFGLNVDPNTGGLAIAARIAAIADAAGLEYAGVQDHPYPFLPHGPGLPVDVAGLPAGRLASACDPSTVQIPAG